MAKELIHEILPVGMLQCNCQIIGDPETYEAIVIDPGDEVDKILEILKNYLYYREFSRLRNSGFPYVKPKNS